MRNEAGNKYSENIKAIDRYYRIENDNNFNKIMVFAHDFGRDVLDHKGS